MTYAGSQLNSEMEEGVGRCRNKITEKRDLRGVTTDLLDV